MNNSYQRKIFFLNLIKGVFASLVSFSALAHSTLASTEWIQYQLAKSVKVFVYVMMLASNLVQLQPLNSNRQNETVDT